MNSSSISAKLSTENSTDASAAPLIEKHAFANPECHPYEETEWTFRAAEITDEKGGLVFRQEGIEVPKAFSDLATKILSSKYFYGDPDGGRHPSKGGREHSFKQVVDRVVNTLSAWGLEDGYFQTGTEARIFKEDLTWLLVNQVGAFNSPVWFNLGLYHEYGVGRDSAKGNFYWKPDSEAVRRAPNQYEYPQCSACFIQHVEDDLESIMDLAKAEAMLFKFGSGSGSDLSSIRSTREKLSGGGRPSGPLSFLAVYDSVAGVVKSGGKTRRAAKMNTLKDFHPDIEEFIEAKPAEERKAWALIEEGYDPSFNGEAYGSIKFQNENLSVRVSDEFMQTADVGGEWWTRRVTDGEKCEKKNASILLDKIAEGTHLCGDPGLQFDDTIHTWHTCKGSGRQNCTNPCSEYLFLDNSACNLASINLLKFRTAKGFDFERFAAACRIFIIAQEIIVDRSSYPTEGIAYNSHWFRTLGLGYANLGALLMSYGLSYDSAQGRNLAGLITSIMTGSAYLASTELAAQCGPFAGYHDAAHFGCPNPPQKDNVESMNAVMELHCRAVDALDGSVDPDMYTYTQSIWRKVLKEGRKHGFRNAQVTVLAPTGTIGFLMDCDTTGIEPAIGLVAYKSLAGGGFLQLPIKSIPQALANLGYSPEEQEQILAHVEKYGTVEPVTSGDETIESGLREDDFPIFDTAFRSGSGKRVLTPRAHIDMMSAVQPFLSGGISKTVNMPQEATVEAIRETYLYAWKNGIKGVAIYRDGSKRSAPVKTRKDDEATAEAGAREGQREVQVVTEPYRRQLPDTRNSLTHKFNIGGTKGYLTVGQFDDGAPGEVFIQMAKAGSTINGLMDSVGTLLSLCLQYGVPLETLVKKFAHIRFEPEGMTRNPDVPMAKSVMDYLARWLGMEFIPGYRERMSPAAQADEGFEDKAPNSVAIENEDHPERTLTTQQMELLVQSEGNLTCPECGSSKVKVTGTCACCLNCGTSLGCS
jgi:ribonucleoside-diphosphate reductase alpha chain